MFGLSTTLTRIALAVIFVICVLGVERGRIGWARPKWSAPAPTQPRAR